MADDLARRFTFHPVTDDQVSRDRAAKHERLRSAGLTFAQLVTDLVDDVPERRRALDAIDDAVMLANAGLARPAPSVSIGQLTAGVLGATMHIGNIR